MPFGVEKKTRMVSLPYSENFFKGIFIHGDRMYERDGQTDRQMDGHRTTAKAAFDESIARQKVLSTC